ncbi:MAG: FAD-dependent thymidylate synthase [Clostridia bacterium]|nr:FAD-dependent thymidylate synthase [Clostridia bacterium]
MPKNNNLKPVKLPMKIRFNEKPTTKFVNNLDAIDVELIKAPTMNELRNYLVPFLEATWAEHPMDACSYTIEEKDKLIRDAMFGRALPTALETIELVFKLDGISLQEVTHILRHRLASFSADCSGDKWWSHKDALVPNSIQNSTGSYPPVYNESKDFYKRYQQIVEMSKQLYCDMIDSKQISIMDARYILPRCLSTFYFMKISLKECIAFIQQRMDKQIQPETDNIIAYQMYVQLLRTYPVMNGLINIHAPSHFYVRMARTGKATNLYFPDADSDKFEWNEMDFIYGCTRDQLNGTNPGAKNRFNELMAMAEVAIAQAEAENEHTLSLEYAIERGELDIPEDMDDEK